MNRDYGLDIYKIIATFMVFVLHISDQGGVIRQVNYASSQYFGVWFLIAFAYCAVNCFGIASGYLLVNHKFKYSRIIVLWLEVFFYSVIFNIIFQMLTPGHVSMTNWLSACLPVLMREYWYFTAYFGMFFFIPFFNKLIHSMNRRQLVSLLVTIILVISCLSSINREIFYLKSGYSMMWLCSLYLVGAIIKQLDLHVTTKAKVWSILISIIFAILAVISRVVIHIATVAIFHAPHFEGGLYLYNSPLILFTAVAILLVCKDITLTPKLHRLVKWLSNTSFGCYLIQVHPLVFSFFRDKFAFLAHCNVLIMCLGILWIALVGLFLGSAIDWLRIKLFSFLHVNQFAQRIVNSCGRVIDKI